MTNIISLEAIEQAKQMFQTKDPLKSNTSSGGANNGRLDVGAYLENYKVPYRTKTNEAGTLYRLEHCLFDPSHTKNESSIIQKEDGKLLYQCFHDSCKGRTWKEARKIISGDDNLNQFFPSSLLAPEKEIDILSILEPWDYIRGLEIQVEWVVDRLIPKEAITVLFGRGGIGKTWLVMDMARAIGSGTPFLGLQTIQSQVIYIDFENPQSVLNERTQKLGNRPGVVFWRANNNNLKPPKIDSKNWELYKKLPKGSVLIFDSLRSSHDRDENASDQMGLVMERLKELRDMGFTIIVLHHTPKNSDRMSKGSTAIVDLSDHILGLNLIRKKKDGQEVIIEDEDSEEDTVYRFGFREKTRFAPYHIYLTLNPDRGFELAPDPQEGPLSLMKEFLPEI